MSVLVVDVGTSGLRAAVARPNGEVVALHHRPFPPSSPFPGLVEFDATGMAAAVLEVAHLALAEAGPVQAVGVTAQRASTIVWDRATGEPVGPGIGWQDLRTVFDCITAKAEHGLALAPNQSATKAAWLLNQYDPGRDRDLCFGTVDTWVAWVLSKGAAHVTDHSNAAVTGLLLPDATGWNEAACAALGVPMAMLPRLVDTTGVFGAASALPGAPPLAALVGDSRAASWARAVCGPARRRSRSAPAACSTCAPAAARRVLATAPPTARSPSSPGARRANSRGAPRRSCCRPAPTSSGW
jgi:glycerol kinase